MSGIAIAEFRRIADVEMLTRGYRKLRLLGDVMPVYTIETGELVRYFAPHAIRRPWGCVMQGIFGVTIPALRDWLSRRGERPNLGGLGYYLTNEPQFRSPVSVVDEADLLAFSRWIDAIDLRVLSLPSDIDTLRAISEDSPAHLILLRESVPEFWGWFEKWSAGKAI